MTNLLSPEDLAAIKEALMDVRDTFFKKPITIRHRVVTQGAFGESAVDVPTDHHFVGLYEFTRADGGRYHTVEGDPNGQEAHDGWRFFLWKEDVDAKLTVDPTTDRVIVDAKEYIIKFWAASALFGDLGELFYELEISFDTTT